MRRLARPKPLLLIFSVIALIALLAIGQYMRLFERAWFNLHTLWQPLSSEAIGLDQYRVDIEARVIDGLDDDVSALTYDPVRDSLFTVTNKNSELVELSLEGKILRRIPLVGFGDAEAVEFISDNIYVISDERQQRLIKVH
ncbi:MAG: SdiA-regulated domain-containing protein, partial [Pseudomonas sp.]